MKNNTIPLSLHVLGSLNRGGVETWLMNIVRKTSRDELPIDACLINDQSERGDYADEFEHFGGRIHHCPGHRNPVRFARRFRRIVREGGYRVVHSHIHHFSGIVLKAAAGAGAQIRIAHCHSDTRRADMTAPWHRRLYLRYTEHLLRHHATVGLACSEAAAIALFGERWLEDRRCHIMLCGIDFGPFKGSVDREALRREFGFEPHHYVVGHVGRFHPVKNHEFLVEIAAAAVRMNPNVRVLLVGDGPSRPQIQAKVDSLGLTNFISFAGPRTDVPKLMLAVMDVFVLPSRWEGFPLVLVEAQAAGLCCVISDVIARESDLVPTCISRVSLDQPATAWARSALSGRPNTDRTSILAALSRSEASLEHNIGLMREVYR